MKKVLIALVLLLVVGAVVAGAVLLLGAQNANPANATGSSSSSGLQNPELGVMKPIETHADAMEALSYELSQNSDTVGWLMIPGTAINNSVLQSHNNVTYLNQDERKKDSVYGCYFVDYECSVGAREVLSPNTIIYGHSDLKENPEGPKFSQLFRFVDEEFARKTPYLYFSTLEDYMVWQVFAVLYTDTQMGYIYPNLEAQALTDLIEEAKLKSIYNYDVSVSAADKILTLSTCARKYGSSPEQRLVIMAKLMPKDHMEQEQAQFWVNPNPIVPKLD